MLAIVATVERNGADVYVSVDGVAAVYALLEEAGLVAACIDFSRG